MSNVQEQIKDTMNGQNRPSTGDFGDQVRDKMRTTIDAAQAYSTRAKEMAGRAGEETVGFVKRHPVNSALAVGLIGLFAGWLIGRRPRK